MIYLEGSYLEYCSPFHGADHMRWWRRFFWMRPALGWWTLCSIAGPKLRWPQVSGIPNPSNMANWKITHLVRRVSHISLLKLGWAEGVIVMAGEVRVPQSGRFRWQISSNAARRPWADSVDPGAVANKFGLSLSGCVLLPGFTMCYWDFEKIYDLRILPSTKISSTTLAGFSIIEASQPFFLMLQCQLPRKTRNESERPDRWVRFPDVEGSPQRSGQLKLRSHIWALEW